MAWMWSVFSKMVNLLPQFTLQPLSSSHYWTGKHFIDFVGALHFLWKTQFKGCGQKKIERISLEGELSWVAGHKNRKAPNRCSYHTSPTSAFFNSISSSFVVSACQKICVARGAAPRPTTPTHFVPRPYPGNRFFGCPPYHHSLLILSSIERIIMRFFWILCLFDIIPKFNFNSGYVASPTNGYPPAPHPAHSPGSALPYHQVTI